METTRRRFFAGCAALGAAIAALVTPSSVFAAKVRQSRTRLNGNMKAHTERRASAAMPYTALEDPEAFHELAEHCRLAMIERLRAEGAPINVWRVGMVGGIAASRISVLTGETTPWKDEHRFYVRTRASVEHEPRQYIEGVHQLPTHVVRVRELPGGRLVQE